MLKTKKGERNLSGKRKTALASHHPTPEQKKKKNIESITKKRKVPETKLHAAPKKKQNFVFYYPVPSWLPSFFCPRRTLPIPNRSFFLPPKKLWLIDMAMSSCGGTQVP